MTDDLRDAVTDYIDTRYVTLREMVEAMAHCPDDQAFRWFQTSYTAADGSIHPGPTFRVSMAQARSELGVK